MNNMQFVLECAKDPTWEDQNVRTLSLGFILGSEENLSQVRQGGIDNAHLSELQDSMILHGQQVPITIEEIEETTPTGQSQYALIDGGHRLLTIQKLAKMNPGNPRWGVIRACIKEFDSDYDRKQYQHEANDHTLPAKSNSNDDAVLWLNELVTAGIAGSPASLQALLHSTGRNKTDPTGYETDLREALSYQFPNMGSRRRNNVVRCFLKKLPGKFRTWDSERSNAAFHSWAESVDIVLPSNPAIISIREKNHVFHNAAGNSLAATTDKETKNRPVIALVWSNKTSGQTVTSIDDARIETIGKINEINSHSKLGRGKKFINQVFIAPQKIDGETAETGFYEVPTNGNGKFTLSEMPKGWDTGNKETKKRRE